MGGVEGRRGVEPLMHPHVGHLLLTAMALVICYLCCALPCGQTSINQFFFEKAILDDAFHDVVNDAVNDVRAVAPVAVPLGIQQELL